MFSCAKFVYQVYESVVTARARKTTALLFKVYNQGENHV